MVVSGPGHDIVVAVKVDSFHGHVATVPHHVVVAFAGVVPPRRVVDRRTVGVDSQASRSVAAAVRKDGVGSSVARQAFHGRPGGAELGAAEAGWTVELDRREAATLDHHLPDNSTLLQQHLTCAYSHHIGDGTSSSSSSSISVFWKLTRATHTRTD